jgi:endonuclease/exonuclease/phosphatase family metal-dependent hydrolase
MPKTLVRLTKLKILSFNILAEQFIDYTDLSVDYPGISPEILNETNRLPKMFAFLKSLKADIMLLQEVNFRVLKLIKSELSSKYFIYPLAIHRSEYEPTLKGEAYGNLILIRNGIASIGAQKVYRAKKTGNAFAFLEVNISGNKVLIVNIHLDADVKESKRREEVAVLLNLLTPYLDEFSIIISGDFNTSNPTTHKKFTKFKPAIQEQKGTYLNDDPMIDWIYVKNVIRMGGKVLRPAKTSAATPLKKYGSDHYPIVADIALHDLP